MPSRPSRLVAQTGDEPMRLHVLPSVERVLARSSLVFPHPERVAPAVAQWGDRIARAPSWEHPCHYYDGTEETVRWIFTLDVLNHCFWPDPGEPVWTVSHAGTSYSGYWGLAASLKRALGSGVPVTDPLYLSRISEEDLERIFSGQGRIPLFEARLRNLREAGQVILSEFGGDIAALVRKASGSAVRLVNSVVAAFPSFRDEAFHRGQPVYFWKRAQIFVSDLHAAFGGKKWGSFADIANLTAFADYKLPQVLRELGIISYAPALAAKVDSLEYLQPGSEEEIEIRAATIRAVEQIRGAFRAVGVEVESARVDAWLWQLGQMDAFRNRPYHRCRTIFY